MVDGGYIESGNYYFYINDHLGNNRIVADAAASVVQSTQYCPFGASFADAISPALQPYKYNNKELDARNGLNMYDYSARWKYDWFFPTVDPMAEKHYNYSPYAYCLNNPLRYIDPLGMDTINIYQSDGNIHSTRAGGNDVFYIVDNNVTVIQKDENPVSISFNSNIVGSQSSESLVTKYGTYSYDLYKISDEKSATSLYEFLADNTAVEWPHGGYSDGTNLLTTTHDVSTEMGLVGTVFNMIDKGNYPVFLNHSHPSGTTVPSGLMETGIHPGDVPAARTIEGYMGKGVAAPSYNIYIYTSECKSG